ncbi:SLOG family protein [Nocardia goodfellowii]
MSGHTVHRILVTGSRSWDNSVAIRDALQPYRCADAVLVHGGAAGADKLAGKIWSSWGKAVEEHVADWDREGKTAGYRRNERMVAAGADVCLAFIRDESRGASHTADIARKAGIPVIAHDYTPRPVHQPGAGAAAQDSYKTITTALEKAMGPGRGNGDRTKWTNYLCPVHEGDGGHHNPSLGVRYDAEQQRTIVRCWAACDDEQVLARLPHPSENRSLQVRDMFDRLPTRDRPSQSTAPSTTQQAPTPRVLAERAISVAGVKPGSKPDRGRPVGEPVLVDTYIYRWPDGRPEGAVGRIEIPCEHGYKKDFPQKRWTGTQWEPGRFAPIPYGLETLREALDSGRDIYICEGEKDVHAIRRAGEYATTNAMGAGCWAQEHARWLRGASSVVVVADINPAGYHHAAKVAGSLAGTVNSLRVLQARDGVDVSNHFDAGHDLSDLEPVPVLDRHYRARGRTHPTERDQDQPRPRTATRSR